jgi:hypothetical protein
MFNMESCLCFAIITYLQPFLISLNGDFSHNVLIIAGSSK